MQSQNLIVMNNQIYKILLILPLAGALLFLNTGCATESEPGFEFTTESVPEDAGFVTPQPGTFEQGARVEIKAEPKEGYQFDRWEGDIIGTDNPVTIAFFGNRKARAVFVLFDDISGTYILEGTQINKTFCYVGCFTDEPGAVLTSDTLNTSFIIEIQRIDERPDTLQFFGLEHFKNYDSCSPKSNSRDCAYARLTGNKLEFDRGDPFGWYYGEGTLDEGKLELETQFRYRGMGVDYRLSGYRTDE